VTKEFLHNSSPTKLSGEAGRWKPIVFVRPIDQQTFSKNPSPFGSWSVPTFVKTIPDQGGAQKKGLNGTRILKGAPKAL